jgi:hypothetical protein
MKAFLYDGCVSYCVGMIEVIDAAELPIEMQCLVTACLSLGKQPPSSSAIEEKT